LGVPLPAFTPELALFLKRLILITAIAEYRYSLS
jgi:hypothetical protein